MSDDTVTQWMINLAQGDQSAAQRLWQRYCERLAGLARRRLPRWSRRVADEEDVALDAFQSFCGGVAAGRFPRLNDRHDLWKVLVTLTARKAISQVRQLGRAKRGGKEVRGKSVFIGEDGPTGPTALDQLLGQDPTPEFVAQMTEQCQLLLSQLEDSSLQQLAIWKLEGYTNEEIAQRANCALRTVKRKLARIRAIWEGRS